VQIYTILAYTTAYVTLSNFSRFLSVYTFDSQYFTNELGHNIRLHTNMTILCKTNVYTALFSGRVRHYQFFTKEVFPQIAKRGCLINIFPNGIFRYYDLCPMQVWQLGKFYWANWYWRTCIQRQIMVSEKSIWENIFGTTSFCHFRENLLHESLVVPNSWNTKSSIWRGTKSGEPISYTSIQILF